MQACNTHSACVVRLLVILLFSLLYLPYYSNPIFGVLLPATVRLLSEIELLGIDVLPRNLKSSGGLWTVVNNLTKTSTARTQRLLKSPEELEREIRGSLSMSKSDHKDKCESMTTSFYGQSR